MDSSVCAHVNTYLCYYTIVSLQVSKGFKQVQEYQDQALNWHGWPCALGGVDELLQPCRAGTERQRHALTGSDEAKKASIPHNTQVI